MAEITMFEWTCETDHLQETQDQNQAADKGLLARRHPAQDAIQLQAYHSLEA